MTAERIKDAIAKDYVSLGEAKRKYGAAAADELRQQEYWQRYNAAPKRVYMSIIGAPGTWQADLLYYPFQGKLKPVLAMVEVTSRRGMAYPLRDATAASVKEALERGMPADVHAIEWDGGGEFKGSVRPYLTDKGIKFHELTKQKLAMGKAEAFNRTLRRMLNWYTQTKGPNWPKGLPELLKIYNGRVHSQTGYAPDAVDADIANKIRGDEFEKSRAYLRLLRSFKPGDRVRVQYGSGARKLFRKEGAVWSKEVYTVTGTEGYRLTLDGTEPRTAREVQRVDAVAEAPKIRKDVSEETRLAQKKQDKELRLIDAKRPTREVAALGTDPLRRVTRSMKN